ncbi:MAG: glycosyltransferase family 2 protein [bacterium]|nr:glycosyltransferase family 2 protein [bacterium]
MEQKTISIVIPVFNEEKAVKGLVEAVLGSGLASEVICVNDGSSDSTQKILESFGGKITLIDLKRNHGKGFALVVGVRKAKGEIIVFLDADLLNLKKDHLEKLIAPLLANQAEVVLAKISLSPSSNFEPSLPFTGQRAYWRKDLLPHLKQMAKTRYGVEVYLNEVFKKKRVRAIKLKGLYYLQKRKKMDLSSLPFVYLAQTWEIGKTLAGIEKTKLKKNGLLLDRKDSFKLTDSPKILKKLKSLKLKDQSFSYRQLVEMFKNWSADKKN